MIDNDKNLQFILHISYTNKNANFPFNNMYIYTIFIVIKKTMIQRKHIAIYRFKRKCMVFKCLLFASLPAHVAIKIYKYRFSKICIL